MNKRKPNHFNIERLQFSIFTSQEVRELSVIEIVNPLTFDTLGHQVNGGLYDKALGPVSDKHEACKTCSKPSIRCQGHFGHINLPLPVTNPMFHKIIAHIFKITCLSCHHLQIKDCMKKWILTVLGLADSGLVSQALDMYELIIDMISRNVTHLPENAQMQFEAFEAQLALSDVKVPSKNAEEVRARLISNILGAVKKRDSCLHCSKSLTRLKTIKNKLIVAVDVNVSDGNVREAKELQQLTPKQSREHMRSIWTNERDFLMQIIPALRWVHDAEHAIEVLFLDVIAVVPSCARPVNFVNGRMIEHSQTLLYKKILMNSQLLSGTIKVMQNDGDTTLLPEEILLAHNLTKGKDLFEKMNNIWDELQSDVNFLMDCEMKLSGEQGLKQLIEKKEGIIRKHMMGKRVNFAARSVITPDPNLNIEEIGVPEAFAKHLTYPVPVSSWNVKHLRQLIENGPDKHPGAVMIEDERGQITRITDANKKAILKRLLTPQDNNMQMRPKIVHRHLCNGDVMLLNRQPTLHKPSIMAHTARVLKGEKTLRLHYANCKAYNADFDGDEMNAHFPQSEQARSEAYNIINVSNQYLVPKDGTPLSGLIQDHMIAGVRMTTRGTFFNRNDYHQLVYQGLSTQRTRIYLLPPCILKPQQLWSGKQIISTLIRNIIPTDCQRINLNSTSKIPSKAWMVHAPRKWRAGGEPFRNPNAMSEAEVVIRHGELLCGILDKAHYGATPYGLVHCMYELYGGGCATKLLSSLAKTFTYYLQLNGFTLGVEDILVMKEADAKRTEIIKQSRQIGKRVMIEALNLRKNATDEEIVEALEEQGSYNPNLRNIIDRTYKSSLDPYTNDINKTCLPAGLICKFPANNLQLMVTSGAKGSTVNTMQISCLLGQIELEGKRPPCMISGRSLPSFPPFEFAPRAGGFIDGRFMSGIKQQEFFFHCMAGREGLIDTAVKTSRSGYLQRCLVKHLEGLSVHYDLSVRDSDMSVIQFNYGEDALDISKAQFFNAKQMPFLIDNASAIVDSKLVKEFERDEQFEDVKKAWKELKEYDSTEHDTKNAFSKFVDAIRERSDKLQADDIDEISSKTGRLKLTKYATKLWHASDFKSAFTVKKRPPPVTSKFQPDVHYGAINERLANLLESNSTGSKSQRKLIGRMFKLKAMQSVCAPGEPVGMLAAQSIGEPSTQMTLNTFHFAGRGEMNVTLGIPRLREILMMASANIKTPSMVVPILPEAAHKADKLRRKMARVVLADVLEKVEVEQDMELMPVRQYNYKVRFSFLPHRLYKADYHVKPKQCIDFMEKKYFKQFFTALRKTAKIKTHLLTVDENKARKKATKKNGEDGEEDEYNANATQENNADDLSSEDELPEDEEDAKAMNKYAQQHDDADSDNLDETRDDNNDDFDENEEKNENNQNNFIDDDEVMAKRSNVVDKHQYASNYQFDTKKYQWCELTFKLPLNFKKIDLSGVIKDSAARAVIWEIPGIKRAITYTENDRLMLRTDGISFQEMFKYYTILDLNKLYSNDIHAVAATYGIEAATKVLVKEVRDVFKVYGITVDPRHLLLIADYMTYSGVYRPLSRKGMENNASPLQQISFESSLTFLRDAMVKGKSDSLNNPSASLMMGKICKTGTGSFSLMQNFRTNLR